MIDRLFDRLGRRPGIGRIVDGLYDRIDRDPRLRPFFPGKRPEERERQKLSFEELFGGEARYSAAGLRHYGTQRRHLHRTITPEASEIWLGHFRESMRDAGIAPALCDEVIDALTPAAYRLTNPGAPFEAVKESLKLASRGDLAGVQRALQAEPRLLDQRGRHGATMLWEASRRGRLPIVTWLVGHGARIDIPGATTDEASVLVTPYVIARKAERSSVVAFFEGRGATLDIFGASFLDDVDAVASTLLGDPAAVTATTPEEDFYPVTPLHYAIDGGAHRAARLLIERGAEVARYSTRLLMLSARAGGFELTRLLLENGADARLAEHLGPLEAGDDRIARLLIAHGLDVNRRISGGKETFLTRATRGDKGEHPDAVRALLDLGADVNCRDAEGRTALHNAARAGFVEVARLLLERGADAAARDNAGSTALDLALKNRRSASVGLLRAGQV